MHAWMLQSILRHWNSHLGSLLNQSVVERLSMDLFRFGNEDSSSIRPPIPELLPALGMTFVYNLIAVISSSFSVLDAG